MAGLIDEEYLRKTFRIHDDVEDERLAPYLFPAGRRLRKWVGAETYASGETETKAILQLAEGLLVMHLLILNINTAIRSEGLIESEKREDDAVIQYFSLEKTKGYAQMYLEQAQEVLGELTGADSLPGVFEIISDGECRDGFIGAR